MKQLLVITLAIFFTIKDCSHENKSSDQQISRITICDTSKINIYNEDINDTLIGRGTLRLKVKSKECNNLIIEKGKFVFFQIYSSNDKIIDYRYLINEDKLSNEDKEQVVFYENKIVAIFKERGLCCASEGGVIEYESFDYMVTFKVIPKKQ